MFFSWSTSIWFFDLDDTLVSMDGTLEGASAEMVPVLAKELGAEKANQIRQNFLNIFKVLLIGHRLKNVSDWDKIPDQKREYDLLVEQVKNHQHAAAASGGSFKLWSREVFIKLAADQAGVSLPPALVHEATAAYWVSVADNAALLPGSLELFQEIMTHGRPVFLLTGSDAHLQMQPTGQFSYDPKYSADFKMKRIRPLEAKGLRFHAVSIGDPIDKPHPQFYKNAVAVAEEILGKSIDIKFAIMVGDSFESDLRVPKEELGFGLVVLLDKHTVETKIVDEHQIVTNNLENIVDFFQ